MRGMYRRGGVVVSLALSAVSMAVLWAFVRSSSTRDDFYAVIPHDVMVGIFGAVGVFVMIAFAIGIRRAISDFRGPALSGPASGGPERPALQWSAIRDAFTLRHLHATGQDCTSNIEVRT